MTTRDVPIDSGAIPQLLVMMFRGALYMYYWMTSEVENYFQLNFPFLFVSYLELYLCHEDCTHRNVKIDEIPFVTVLKPDGTLMAKMWK